jgi:hypothetical protein
MNYDLQAFEEAWERLVKNPTMANFEVASRYAKFIAEPTDEVTTTVNTSGQFSIEVVLGGIRRTCSTLFDITPSAEVFEMRRVYEELKKLALDAGPIEIIVAKAPLMPLVQRPFPPLLARDICDTDPGSQELYSRLPFSIGRVIGDESSPVVKILKNRFNGTPE